MASLFPLACLAGVALLSILDVLATEATLRPGPAREREVERRCPYCHAELEGALVRCRGCATEHHEECWSDNGRCSVFGCETTGVAA